MKDKGNSHTMMRYALVSVLIMGIAAVVVWRLVHNTIVDAKGWEERAAKEQVVTKPITPLRGDLLSDDGRILSTNITRYTLRIDFTSEQFRVNQFKASLDSLCDSLALHFPVRDKDQWKDYLSRPLPMIGDTTRAVVKVLRSWPLLLRLDDRQVSMVKKFPFFKINNSAKTGLVKEDVEDRAKPFGALARQSIGSVSQDTSSRQRHGRSGLEGALDSLLYGTPGVTRKVTLTRGNANWTDTPAVRGWDVHTTINVDIQDIVESELHRMLDTTGADWGTAILMEVSTGDIKAISNLQLTAAGTYTEGMNRAVRPFEPGSVVKPISMLIALEDGIVSPDDPGRRIDIHGGVWNYPNAAQPIKDTHRMASVRLDQVLPFSSNIATAKIIMSRYGHNPPAFIDRLGSIGLGERLGVGISGEWAPVVKQNPSAVDLSRIAYGYTSAIPPMHTLAVYNAIANDGRMVRPRLYTRLERPDTVVDLPVTTVREQVCTPRNAAALRQMLRDVVVMEGGTARLLRNPTVAIAGKTGTCYVHENGHYNKAKKRLAFAGFFPADSPRYSCMVLIEWPKRHYMGAASSSGQVVRNIALQLHARGLLGNSSDWTADTHPGTVPMMYAMDNIERYREAFALVGASRGRRFDIPPAGDSPPGTVPAVCGLSLREALLRLEDAGYRTDAQGHGYVKHQHPAPGDTLPPGETVTLRLTQDT